MILVDNAHALDYLGLNPNLDKALRLIAEAELSLKPDGPFVLAEDAVMGNISRQSTRYYTDGKLEGHREYIDIFILFEGEEDNYVCFRDSEGVRELGACPERDFYVYSGEGIPVRLRPGQSLILFPNDLHAPGVCVGEPPPCESAS